MEALINYNLYDNIENYIKIYMPKIKLEREKCIGCGSCQAVCPRFFELKEDGKSSIIGAQRDGAGNDELEVVKLECAESASEACPVQCIHIEK